MDELRRLAFIEQVAGAPPTHQVVAQRTQQVVYTGPKASSQLVAESYMAAYISGDDEVGPVDVVPLEGTAEPTAD